MRVGLVGDLREVRVVLLELGLRTQSQQLTLQTRIRSNLQNSTRLSSMRGCPHEEGITSACSHRLWSGLGYTYGRHREVLEVDEGKKVRGART